MAVRGRVLALVALGLLGCDGGDAVTGEVFACTANEDCAQGFWCSGGRCKPGQFECAGDLDCPDDRVCVRQVCSEIGDGRCRQDTDCPGDKLCVDGQCAPQVPPPCGVDDDCGAGQACRDGQCVAVWAEVCNGQDDDGDGVVDEGAPVGALACPPVGLGACERPRTAACLDGAVRCPDTAPGEPAAETCNRVDDDCDGRTDEGVTNACGACDAPDGERCDGEDNDCDGSVDEGFGLGEPCRQGLGACQRLGEYVCADDGRNRCSVEAGPAGDEICNGADDDCDGATDETFPEQGACPVGEGACQVQGQKVCVNGALRCDGQPGAPVAETCNGVDDDCDGTVDDVPGLGNPCAVGDGPCRAEGALVCAQGPQPVCDAVPPAPAPEICNNLDDDCDGIVDNVPGQGGVCGVGEGACAAQGRLVCGDGPELACDAQPGMPAPEGCNGLDDDCDGTVDEEVCGGGPGCVQDADCREGVCYQGACALVCLGAGDICCDADGDRCVIESEWCGAPGPDLDPCPRARYWRTDVGTCLGVDCQAPQILANGSQDCRAAGFDVCIEGACVNDAGCGPAACGGQAEFFACSPTPDRARCVAGDCLGWASFLDQANGRGPVYQVPLQRPNRADRFEVRNDGQGDVWFDNASRLAWRPDAGPQPFTALNLVAAHQRCFDFGPGWRLPGLHDLVTLLGAPNVMGGGPLASRTTRFEQVKELNLPFVDEAVGESHVAGPGGRPFTFLCVQHEMGVVQPPIRLDQQGRDLWVGFEWVDLPELHASIADAETACRAQGATLARVEEIFARIDLRPVGGNFVDSLTGQPLGTDLFAWVGNGESAIVTPTTGRIRRQDGQARARCVRSLAITPCSADADCVGPGGICRAGRCEAP